MVIMLLEILKIYSIVQFLYIYICQNDGIFRMYRKTVLRTISPKQLNTMFYVVDIGHTAEIFISIIHNINAYHKNA